MDKTNAAVSTQTHLSFTKINNDGQRYTEYKYKKNTAVIVYLCVGDTVRTNGWGPQLDGKDHTIIDLKFNVRCESGVMILIDGYDSYLDSGWFTRK